MKYSVVIPIKNEEENIEGLVEELELVMNGFNEPWELICVDDGSTDNSLYVLQQLKSKKPYINTIVFSKNFGQSSAFAAGFHSAKGEFIITMDGDGQNDPADIPKLFNEMKKYDLVCGWRVNRKDPTIKKIISYIANTTRKNLLKDKIHDTSCSLKICRRSSLQKIKLFKGMHRFLPALFQLEGLKVKEIPVNHRPRKRGQSKYNFFNRLINPIVDTCALIWMRKRRLLYEIRRKVS